MSIALTLLFRVFPCMSSPNRGHECNACTLWVVRWATAPTTLFQVVCRVVWYMGEGAGADALGVYCNLGPLCPRGRGC